MSDIWLVGLGGFLGSIARFKMGAAIAHHTSQSPFPWGTFAINVLGCLLVGVVAALLQRLDFYNAQARLLLISGVLGGFTTFSAFGLETFALIRSGSVGWAILYALGSLAAGILAVWAGTRMLP